MRCVDFNGKEFQSVKDMCKYYGVKPNTYKKRLRQGFSLKDALLGKHCVDDYLGNHYINIQTFLNTYDICRSFYDFYIKLGYSSVEISAIVAYRKKELTFTEASEFVDLHKIPHRGMGTPIEFNGKYYLSIKELCEAYNVKYYTYLQRQYRRWSFEECILGRKKNKEE